MSAPLDLYMVGQRHRIAGFGRLFGTAAQKDSSAGCDSDCEDNDNDGLQELLFLLVGAIEKEIRNGAKLSARIVVRGQTELKLVHHLP